MDSLYKLAYGLSIAHAHDDVTLPDDVIMVTSLFFFKMLLLRQLLESGLTAACQCRHMLPRCFAGCFAVLCQRNSIRRSVRRESLIGLVVSLVLTRLDYCNAVFAGLPAYQLDRLQAAISEASGMIY